MPDKGGEEVMPDKGGEEVMPDNGGKEVMCSSDCLLFDSFNYARNGGRCGLKMT